MSENNTVDFTPFNEVETLNKQRKLKILSQAPNEMIVEISRVNEPSETEQENAINATTLNSRFTEMKNSLNSALNEKTGSVVRVKGTDGEYNATDVNFDSDPQTQLNERVKTSDLLNKIYPIGSIYMSTINTNPADLLGGTWVELQDRFLIGAGNTYELGATGGESTHVLTVNEMPSHTHAQNAHSHTQAQHRHNFEVGTGYYNDSYGGNNSKAPTGTQASRVNGNFFDTSYTTPTINSTTATNQNTGGGQAHNNMPPYLAVYMWKRTA